jgi:hypothetical protein
VSASAVKASSSAAVGHVSAPAGGQFAEPGSTKHVADRLRRTTTRARASRPAIYFVRHGESVANVADRNGDVRPDDGDRLSTHGWGQARDLGRRLRDEQLEAIVASPMRRAQETATAIAGVLGLEVTTDPELY